MSTTTTNLDKSLDDIISAQPRAGHRGRFSKGVKKTSAVRKAAAASTKATKQTAAVQKKQALPDLTALADKVILSNLPTDIDETSVRKYFSAEIGPVSKVDGAYNKNGSRTGSMTLYFKRQGDAARAVAKFNGTAIDNGAKTMKVELIIDPSKKTLGDRLKPTQVAAAAAKSKATPKANKTKKPRAPRRPKKTLEELDADMADYFVDQPAPTTA